MSLRSWLEKLRPGCAVKGDPQTRFVDHGFPRAPIPLETMPAGACFMVRTNEGRCSGPGTVEQGEKG